MTLELECRLIHRPNCEMIRILIVFGRFFGQVEQKAQMNSVDRGSEAKRKNAGEYWEFGLTVKKRRGRWVATEERETVQWCQNDIFNAVFGKASISQTRLDNRNERLDDLEVVGLNKLSVCVFGRCSTKKETKESDWKRDDWLTGKSWKRAKLRWRNGMRTGHKNSSESDVLERVQFELRESQLTGRCVLIRNTEARWANRCTHLKSKQPSDRPTEEEKEQKEEEQCTLLFNEMLESRRKVASNCKNPNEAFKNKRNKLKMAKAGEQQQQVKM
jgi:hypothetical protein